MRVLMLLALSLTACLRTTEFKCSASSQCGAEGVCESTGFCSVPDDQCGRRYSPSAGALAGQCVGGGGIDGGIDGPSNIDASIDAPTGGCPAGYMTLPGAPHMYKLVTQTSTWNAAVSGCAATAPTAYLAIPDDANELAAMTTLAGGSAPYWVGVDDVATEGTWLTVKNAPQTFLPWAPNHPTTNPTNKNDCVRVATNQFTDEACNNQHAAVCECE